MCVLGTLSSIPKKMVLATSRLLLASCQARGWEMALYLLQLGTVELGLTVKWWRQNPNQLNVSQQTWWQMSFGQ